MPRDAPPLPLCELSLPPRERRPYEHLRAALGPRFGPGPPGRAVRIVRPGCCRRGESPRAKLGRTRKSDALGPRGRLCRVSFGDGPAIPGARRRDGWLMDSSTVFVIHHCGKFWRRRHGHARSAWIAGLSRASLYRRLSDAKRACARIEVGGEIQVWEVQMNRTVVAFEVVNHSPQNRVCPSVPGPNSAVR